MSHVSNITLREWLVEGKIPSAELSARAEFKPLELFAALAACTSFSSGGDCHPIIAQFEREVKSKWP